MSGFCELPRVRHNTPMWSELRVEVLAAQTNEQLSAQINALISSGDFNVLAFSAGTTTATFVPEPWTSTLLLQERVNPLNGGHATHDDGGVV